MDIKIVPPSLDNLTFTCPWCNVLSLNSRVILLQPIFENGVTAVGFLDALVCCACAKQTIWYEKVLIHPRAIAVENPNSDMDADIQADYHEAAVILADSPRASAALLRLCVQKLCVQVGEKGKKIDDDIKALVQKGLPVDIQRALDIVRVIGNECVHPGVMDMKDDRATALSLFTLVNYIADRLITQPRKLHEMYESLPQSKLDGIAKRDT